MSTINFNPLKPFGIKTEKHTLLKDPTSLRNALFENKLIVFKKASLNRDELLNLAQKLSLKEGTLQDKVLHWDFGPIMEMHAKPDPKNYLFSEERVPFHWDGAFFEEPLFLIFYCVKTSTTSGGETLFTDTNALYSSLTKTEKKKSEKVVIRYKTEKLAHYGGEINIHFKQKHPHTGCTILRFGEKVETTLNPVTVKIQGLPEGDTESFYDKVATSLYNPSFCYSHSWEEGDLLIADNFSLLHARNALESNKERKFLRLQVL